MQPTSLTAYRDVQPSLGERQALVLAALEGEMTNLEVARKLGWEINTLTPRMKELRDLGLVAQDGKRSCKITGNTAMTWRKIIKTTLF